MTMDGRNWLAVVVYASLMAGCGGEKAAVAPAVKALPEAKPGQAVIDPGSPQLAQIRTESLAQSLVPVGDVSAPGKVEANQNRQSHVVLPVTGRVSTVLAKIGDYVKQGQAVLTLESADVDAAVSALQQANASVTQAKSALAKAQMDLDREKDLFEHGAVPQKEVLNAEAVAVQAKAGVEHAQAAAEQARRRVQILGVEPGAYGQRVTVRAPISGKVLEMSVVPGEYRNDLSAPVMTIADLSSVWVSSEIAENAIRFIKAGESVKITMAAYPGDVFRGRVTLIGDVVDPQTRTLKVRAELPNPEGKLKPEMFCSIQLSEQSEEKVTVPAAAVVASDGQSLVWRELSRGVFEKVPIKTGAQVGDRIAVLEGLKPADRVVVDGVMLLTAR